MSLNKCQLVKTTCSWVYNQSKHVKINQQKIQSIKDFKYTEFHGFQCHNIQLDEQQQLTYLFALDAMNFCFWQNEDVEYEFLAQSVKDGVLGGALTIDKMTTITPEIMKQEVFKNDNIPLVTQRARILNEVSTITIQNFNGLFSNIIKSANNSAVGLLTILTSSFPNFQDHAIYKGHQIHFYKRAQILIGDIYANFKGEGLGKFNDIHELTMFADYRVPQILREFGVLEYSEELEKVIDGKVEILHGGEYEVEIRAATVMAVEGIKKYFKEGKGRDVLSIEVDWFLWEEGEKNLKTLRPHHRVLSIYY